MFHIKKQRFLGVLFALLAEFALVSCMGTGGADKETKTIRILATSDLHGKFMPWEYALNQENKMGSLPQLAAAIKEYRTDHTLLMDAGDLIQENFAEIFVGQDEVHPMVQGVNALDYDVFVTGNHDYNYGMDVLRKMIADLKPTVLVGNVYDESGKPLADGYHIFDVDGVRVAVIGMVSPNIVYWDSEKLKDCKVTDPLEETRKIIDGIQGQYDVLVGVFHMSLTNELDTPNSGVIDICNSCPEFDLMVSSHQHIQIVSEDVNGVMVVQNKYMAQTMSLIDISLEKCENGWSITDQKADSINIGDYDPDPELTETLMPYHKTALEESRKVIGRLEGGPLVPDENSPELKDFPYQSDLAIPRLIDTPLIDLINDVQMYYSGAEVSATCLCEKDSNIEEGDIHKYDAANVYKFNNTLYKIHMNGRQLKCFMEWSVGYFEKPDVDKKELTSDEKFAHYNYMIFDGVNYEINLARQV